MTTRNLVIVAAGTGGHVIPGLAVGAEMIARGWGVSWIGTGHGIENKLVPPRGIPFDRVVFSGLRGKGALHSAGGVWRLVRAFLVCLHLLGKRRADAVLAMGGYLSVPAGWAAWLRRRPLVVVNADATLLLSNRALLRAADRVAFGFGGDSAAMVSNGVVTGNPVRAEIEALAPPETRFRGRDGALRLLVVGGSLGARVLNDTVPAALALLDPDRRPRITHQTGEADHEPVRAAYARAGIVADVRPFIDDMAGRLAECDVIVCRAGAITVSELCAAGVASVLVPFIASTTAHQRDNAAWLASHGAAIHLPQGELTAARLADLLRGLARETLLGMATKARALARPNAAGRVADEIERLVAA